MRFGFEFVHSIASGSVLAMDKYSGKLGANFLPSWWNFYILNLQNTRSPTVLDDVLKSLLVLSDLFQQRSQWIWLLDTCIELSRDPALENDITYQYLLVAICKSVALLSPVSLSVFNMIFLSYGLF